jgi:hypothetical protein
MCVWVYKHNYWRHTFQLGSFSYGYVDQIPLGSYYSLLLTTCAWTRRYEKVIRFDESGLGRGWMWRGM